MAFDDALDVGESNASAFEFSGVVQSLDDAEELVLILRIKSRAIVAHKKSDPSAVLRPGAMETDFDYSKRTLLRELKGVAKEIHQRQAEQRPVTFDHRQIRDLPLDGSCGGV